jgi:hypothetical protein
VAVITGFLFWKRRQRSKQLPTALEIEGTRNKETKQFQPVSEADGTARSELDAYSLPSKPVELSVNNMRTF